MKNVFKVVLFLISISSFAQTKEEKIECILNTSKTIESYRSYLRNYKLAIFKDKDSAAVSSIIRKYDDNTIKKMIIKSFAEVYTENEINKIYDFYTSEIGKTFVSKFVNFNEKLETNFMEIDKEILKIIDAKTSENKKNDNSKSNYTNSVHFDGEDGLYEVVYYDRNFDLKTMKLNKKSYLQSKHFTDAKIDYDVLGKIVIDIQLDKEGSEKLRNLTEKNVGKPIAIVLNKRIISAPVVNDVISGGKIQISGNFTMREAEELIQLKKQ